MSPKTVKQPMNVVEIDSSDGEDGVTIVAAPNKSSPNPKPQPPPPTAKPNYQTLERRIFWKAGNYAVGPTSSSATIQGQLEHARVHPKFLHSNATSHKWAFGAIAELLDNAVDEIHNGATFLKVDKIDIMKDNAPALLFQDDGGGMDPDSIRKCMSLGYSSKKSNKTIGQYGNGFKTSTMRLGADVIVFSRSSRAGKATQSVGLLSYTLLLKTGQDDVIVPMVDFDISGHWAEPIIYSSQDDWSSNLNMIIEWSPFSSKDMLMQQFEDIGPHGTKIIIYNLWLNDEGIYELSFDDDDEDIQLRDDASRGSSLKLTVKTAQLQRHISYRFHYSLRAYASILYLRKFTNFRIILRGKPVEQYIIADDLKNVKKAIYRPQLGVSSKEVAVETTIGFNKEAPDLGVCGFNVYHKNRLIRPFWKVTGEGAAKGNFVVGVLEANFIEPAHDKQDFERSSLYIRLEMKLKQMVADYWCHNCHFIGHQPPGFRANTSNKHTVGHQPPGFGVNTSNKQTAKSQRLVNQGNTGFSVSARKEIRLDKSFDDLSPNLPRMPEDHLASGSAAGSYDEVVSEDSPQFSSADQICEENIQLFMRCEAHRQKETELKNTITELEKELEQGRRKCAQLAAHLETKRKQKSMKEQIQKKVS